MSERCLVWIIAIGLIGYGLVLLLNRDLAWQWTVRSERYKGHSEDSLEQTPEWEFNNALGGIVSVAIGVILIFILLTSS
jgi:hypothetical protein